MSKNLEDAKATLARVRMFQNEMTIILHTSKSAVDGQTYEVFEKASEVSEAAGRELDELIARIEELQARAIPTQQ